MMRSSFKFLLCLGSSSSSVRSGAFAFTTKKYTHWNLNNSWISSKSSKALRALKSSKAQAAMISSSTIQSPSSSSNLSGSTKWVKSLLIQDKDTAQDTGQRHVSIMSWNTLAQYLFDSTPQWYTHVKDDAPVSWPERFPRILNEILDRQADIIALQEIEFEAFENDFKPSLALLGYDGIMQRDRRRNKRTGYGVATFWKTHKFELEHDVHRSRTMATLLREKYDTHANATSNSNAKILALVNCHLEGHPQKSITRVKQLQSILQDISTKFQHHNLVICGDMNSILGHSACSTYLENGSCGSHQHNHSNANDNDNANDGGGQKVWEWGRLVQDNKQEGRLQDIPSHSYTMHSAYSNHLDYITYVNRPGTFTCGLDQIWYHDANNSIHAEVIHPFHSIEHQTQVVENGLPSVYNPSDHMPIGCILHWKKDATDSEVDLCQKIERGYVTRTMNATEAQNKATQLLDTCPFETPEQRQDFLFVISEVPGFVPGLGNRGKPTKEQIEQIRGRRMAKKKLMGEVSEDVREILEEIIVLMKIKQSKS